MQKLSKHYNFRFARTCFNITLDWSMMYCALSFTLSENSKIWAFPSNSTSDTVEMGNKEQIPHFILYITWMANTQVSPMIRYVYIV